MLEPTGERFLLSMDLQIALEHWHRYLAIAERVRGKDIVDVASGEGYGSHFLASFARSVVGMDISADAVAHARARYARPNLRYETGSIAALPLPDGSVDVVVSFETFEHVGAAEQRSFLAEARRVLRPGGTLVLSTPDRDVYSTMRNYSNPYHVHELTRAEFVKTLSESFPSVVISHQRCGYFSIISEDDAFRPYSIRRDDANEYRPSDAALAYEYLIATCRAEPEEPGVRLESSVAFDEQILGDVYDRRSRAIIELTERTRNLEGALETQVRERESESQRASATIRRLESDLARESVRAADLERVGAGTAAELARVREAHAVLSVRYGELFERAARAEAECSALREQLQPANYVRDLARHIDFRTRKKLARIRRRTRERLARLAAK